ncbi:MAG TPA: hypothetical protein VEX86_20910 [Longimicrobium sp.]|nr:hypothetical protein [Longimicrobium sp.]
MTTPNPFGGFTVDMFTVSIPRDTRARVYAAGGIGYDGWVSGAGWVVTDEPADDFERIVWAARRAAYPHLAGIGPDPLATDPAAQLAADLAAEDEARADRDDDRADRSRS